MGVTLFQEITSSDRAARRFLLGFCWKNHQRFCPRCRGRKLYRVGGERRRCARCGYTFHDFSQRFLSGCWGSPRQWLWFLKLFELDVRARDMARQLRCSYATVLKAQDITRRAILAQALDADKLYALGIWPGPKRPKTTACEEHSPVFGLLDLNGYTVCDVLPDLKPEDLLHYKLNFRLKTASEGQTVYTAPCKGYQALVACDPKLWEVGYIHHDDKGVPADSGGFWSYAKARLKKLRGVLPGHFPLYLKEWEMRYNNRDKDLLRVLVRAVCSFVPDPDGYFLMWSPRQADRDDERASSA